MSQSAILTVLQQAITVVLELSAPILLTSLVIGLIISLLQAVTQVNEQAINYVPKIAAIALVIVFVGPWMLQVLLSFATHIFSILPSAL